MAPRTCSGVRHQEQGVAADAGCGLRPDSPPLPGTTLIRLAVCGLPMTPGEVSAAAFPVAVPRRRTCGAPPAAGYRMHGTPEWPSRLAAVPMARSRVRQFLVVMGAFTIAAGLTGTGRPRRARRIAKHDRRLGRRNRNERAGLGEIELALTADVAGDQDLADGRPHRPDHRPAPAASATSIGRRSGQAGTAFSQAGLHQWPALGRARAPRRSTTRPASAAATPGQVLGALARTSSAPFGGG